MFWTYQTVLYTLLDLLSFYSGICEELPHKKRLLLNRHFHLFFSYVFRWWFFVILLLIHNLLALSCDYHRTVMKYLAEFRGCCNSFAFFFFFEGHVMEKDNAAVLNTYEKTFFKVRTVVWEEKLFSNN